MTSGRKLRDAVVAVLKNLKIQQRLADLRF